MPRRQKGEIPVNAIPHQFKPGQSGNPGGRPSNPIPNSLKKLTAQQMRRIIKSVVAGNVDEIKRIVKDPTSSGLEVGIAACYLKAVERGDYSTIEHMISRVLGKIPDKIEIESKNKNLNINATTSVRSEAVKSAVLKLEEEF